jgi:hypothetical protein
MIDAVGIILMFLFFTPIGNAIGIIALIWLSASVNSHD